MPRFFFHLQNERRVVDEDGQDYPDLDTARLYARETIRALACFDVQQGYLRAGDRFDIADENGRVVATVGFDDAITVLP